MSCSSCGSGVKHTNQKNGGTTISVGSTTPSSTGNIFFGGSSNSIAPNNSIASFTANAPATVSHKKSCGCDSEKPCSCNTVKKKRLEGIQVMENCGCATGGSEVPLICLSQNSNVPALNKTADFLFNDDISDYSKAIGLYLYSPAIGEFEIVQVVPDNKIVVKNTGSSRNILNIGDPINAGNCFVLKAKDVTIESSTIGQGNCLLRTFKFPKVGQTELALVKEPQQFTAGTIVKLGGYKWKVLGIINRQLELENTAPGNGSVYGDYLDVTCDTSCQYSVDLVTTIDECSLSGVTEGVPFVCATAGKRKLIGESVGCKKQVLVWDTTKQLASFSNMFTSDTTGPHYIDYNKDTCELKIVSCPSLCENGKCQKLACSFTVVPGIAEYVIEVDSVAIYSATSPNNIIKINGSEFQVLEVLSPTTLNKLKIKPRFTVSGAVNFATKSDVCLVEGCQPFPASDWPFGGTATCGSKTYCTTDGQRGAPEIKAKFIEDAYQESTDLNISTVGTNSRTNRTVTIKNDSECADALVDITIISDNSYRIASNNTDKFEGILRLLVDVDAPAVSVVRTLHKKVLEDDQYLYFSEQVIHRHTIGLNPLQTAVLNYNLTFETTSADGSNRSRWLDTLTTVRGTLINNHN